MDHDYRPYYPLVLRWLSSIIDVCLATGGALIIVIVFGNASMRGFGPDLAWSLEISAFLMLWVTFLGSAAAAARGAHMRVTEIFELIVPERFKALVSLAMNLAIAALMIALIYFGTNTAIHMWPEQTTVLYWPIGLLYASMPVGIFLTLVFHTYNAWLDFAGLGPRHDAAGHTEIEEISREGLA